ncbi:MAG: methyltransferase domain-containing protein [Candidatus Hydrogenedentota bacterium]|nr:MAG: methyltransferase domain-containing protein [Candidatus Hydrogenedentota bacterium]
MTLVEEIKKRIRELRKLHGYTQEKLAEISGIDYKHIQKLEGKDSIYPRIDTLEKIASAFSMSLPEFLDFPDESTKQTYNQIAKEYDAKNKNVTPIKANINRFLEKIEKGAKILDLGCGNGRDAAYFVKLGYKVIGIDFSDAMIKIAKQKTRKATFYNMQLTRLYFEPNTFDAVWANASLLHLSRANFRKALQEIYVVLKENGILYISMKQHQETKEHVDTTYGQERYYLLWNRKELIAEIENANFQMIEFWENQPNWMNILAKKIR